MLRPSLFSSGLVLALLLVCPVGAQAGRGEDGSGGHLAATLNGHPIELASVGLYQCHDLDAPMIRCFETAAERDAELFIESDLGVDAQVSVSGSSVFGLVGALSITYVIYYEHSDYVGASMLISSSISNLGSLGWNNRISSFKSTNGGRPNWWDFAGYGGTDWQWGTSAWVPYVGSSANDRFTSVQNVP